ncbi:hypothetical protein OG429_25940 [Streptomyces sp. NBC_00190]|uniref:hypothetical protein n=1 Tax=Streptomyces sp. NBC_00190 TaxID=2903634 RepID=UPI002E2AC53A|nr:hypothetical protein [Streptomyces sp. NBC_00190]
MNQHPLPLADRIYDAIAVLTGKHTIRCPHPGCGLHIRYRAVTPAEAKRLIDLATEHTRH